MKTQSDNHIGCAKVIDAIENEAGEGDAVHCGDYNIHIPTGRLIQRLCANCDKEESLKRLKLKN